MFMSIVTTGGALRIGVSSEHTLSKARASTIGIATER